jgi:hypothetical protein
VRQQVGRVEGVIKRNRPWTRAGARSGRALAISSSAMCATRTHGVLAGEPRLGRDAALAIGCQGTPIARSNRRTRSSTMVTRPGTSQLRAYRQRPWQRATASSAPAAPVRYRGSTARLPTSHTSRGARPTVPRLSATGRCQGSPAASSSVFTGLSAATISRAVPRAAPLSSSMTTTNRDRASYGPYSCARSSGVLPNAWRKTWASTWRAASRSAGDCATRSRRVSGRRSPACSAAGSRCAGESSPRVGCCHRTSASTPAMRPSRRSICGGRKAQSSSPSRAVRSSSMVRSRSPPAVPVTGSGT